MIKKSLLWAVAALLSAHVVHAQAQEEPLNDSRFQVGDIRVEGLERVSEGTVLNYLPVNIGDELNPQHVREALRALYETGMFRDVELRRDGETLVVDVRERPSIDSFEIQGNKDLKTEELTKSLRGVGMAAGKTFDRSVLEEVKNYLTDQYFSRGKYGVKVETTVEELAGNRVNLTIDIKEGERAKLQQISIVGNTKYKEKDILETFELKTPRWNSWYKQNDRYAREAMQGDLEKLKTWYQDRGYANFDIESVQVTISPEKDDMFVTISIHEGDIYKIADAKIAGNTIVPLRELQALVQVQKGQTYSQQRIANTQKLIEVRLGFDGYAFAKVDPVTKTDDETHEAVVTFVVDPGNRVYVRHINFLGLTRTNDVVLRREMRQLEGSWVSNLALERSKQKMQQLAYIEKVDFEKKKVDGTDDLVDVDYTIKEGPSAQLSGGVGYSESSAFILQGSYADSNFMGTGKRVSFDVNTSKYSRSLYFSHTNPYVGVENISRSFTLRYSDVSQFVSASSDFSSKNFSAGLEIGYPVFNDWQGLRFGVNVTRSELLTTSNSSAQQAQNWVKRNGRPYSHSAVDIFGDIEEFFGSRFTAVELSATWYLQALNRGLFPDSGQKQVLTFSSSIPGTDVEYWVLDYEFLQYVPLWRRFTGVLNLRASYGGSFGGTTGLPPYRLFFGGGPDTVRGYRESRMGPKDDFGNPYGGNLLVVQRSELIIPMPEKFQTSARVSLFHDIGNVFSMHDDTEFFGRDGLTPVTYNFKFANLRRSAGLSVEWLAPLGLFRFSYAIPLNASKGSNVLYPDERERFQFSIGQAF
ncbi:MAG: outer membrane protein assembly factor BamA [Pseudomonadota bacterium]